MFFIRVAFWLSIAILFIPGDPQTGDAPRVSMVNAFLAAKATVADLSGFCDRNPEACDTGGAAIHAFAEKAGNGVRMLYDYLQDPVPADSNSGTLTQDDVDLPWQGSQSNDAA